jgi:hypothetical protein
MTNFRLRPDTFQSKRESCTHKRIRMLRGQYVPNLFSVSLTNCADDLPKKFCVLFRFCGGRKWDSDTTTQIISWMRNRQYSITAYKHANIQNNVLSGGSIIILHRRIYFLTTLQEKRYTIPGKLLPCMTWIAIYLLTFLQNSNGSSQTSRCHQNLSDISVLSS